MRKVESSKKENLKKFFIILIIVWISIIAIYVAIRENSVPDSDPVITSPSSERNSTKMEVAGSDNINEDYEDSSKVVQLILTGDIDIDFYSQDELKYYYHPNSEDNLMDGPDFAVHNAGKYGEQDVTTVHFNKNDYTIKLTSNKNQVSQIGILNEQNLQTLSDFNLTEGDIVEIKYSPEKSYVYYNNNKIEFDGDDSLSSEDVSIMSKDTNQYSIK